MKERYLIVGLGNPGPEYETTRHNIGFLFVDQLYIKKKDFVQGLHKNKTYESFELVDPLLPPCIVAKPLTFMNRSGIAVLEMVTQFSISPQNIIVVHDDLDILLGRMKLKFGGSDAGHNGIKSIISNLGTRDFFRIRIGIGRPDPAEKLPIRDWVLSPFKDFELKIIKRVLDACIEGIYRFFLEGKDKALNFINGFRLENFEQYNLKEWTK